MHDELDDIAIEVALLTFVLHRHPAPVHADELARAFSDVDWTWAARALIDDGLLHREGDLHLPTRAAVRASVLLG